MLYVQRRWLTAVEVLRIQASAVKTKMHGSELCITYLLFVVF